MDGGFEMDDGVSKECGKNIRGMDACGHSSGYPSKYSRDMEVMPSACDYSGRLGVYDTFSLFMDIAAEHANLIGMGQPTMFGNGMFWLTVKTRIRFHERPFMMTGLTASTWPAKPTSFRSDRFYRLEHGGALVAEGCTEWAVMNLKDGSLVRVADLFPKDFQFSDDRVSFEGFPRVSPDFEGCDARGSVTVMSSDVDLGNHMNNAAYVRAMLGNYSTAQLKDMHIKEMSVVFKSSAHEGDRLSMPERIIQTDEGRTIETALLFPDGKPAVLAQIVCS